jgi:hypothetical protein
VAAGDPAGAADAGIVDVPGDAACSGVPGEPGTADDPAPGDAGGVANVQLGCPPGAHARTTNASATVAITAISGCVFTFI